jgi:hypothetical protein
MPALAEAGVSVERHGRMFLAERHGLDAVFLQETRQVDWATGRVMCRRS